MKGKEVKCIDSKFYVYGLKEIDKTQHWREKYKVMYAMRPNFCRKENTPWTNSVAVLKDKSIQPESVRNPHS